MSTATAVRERPTIMPAESVRAILEGRKTQTRRVVKPQPPAEATVAIMSATGNGEVKFGGLVFAGVSVAMGGWAPCPYGVAGDRLWVRETWNVTRQPGFLSPARDDEELLWYRADEGTDERLQRYALQRNISPQCWRSPIFMPRHLSRITLEITDVRVERLQEIDRDGCIAEGCPSQEWFRVDGGPSKWFRESWDAINGKRAPWAANPWVWVLSFRRIEP